VIDHTKKWTHEFPLWVSRKDADGLIYRLTVPMWLALALFLIVVLNGFLWGLYGLYALAALVI
jgi:hypothetical protein